MLDYSGGYFCMYRAGVWRIQWGDGPLGQGFCG
jgi:hypothetical protein